MGKTRQSARMVSDGNFSIDPATNNIGIGTAASAAAKVDVEGLITVDDLHKDNIVVGNEIETIALAIALG